MRWIVLCLLVACDDPRPGPVDAMSDARRDGGADAQMFDALLADAPGMDADANVGDARIDDSSAPDVSTFDSGLGETPRAGDIVIVEIQGNPVTATDEEAEYIEVVNVSGRPLDLMGVTLGQVAYPSGEPSASTATHVIASSVPIATGGRALLARSGGGFFGGSSINYVYGGFVFGNGNETNRLRLFVPGWDGSEPPSADDLIDEVRTELAVFDNGMRGRAWALDPALVPVPTAVLNDIGTNWCSASGSGVEYRANNFGTPGAPNACN